MSRDLDSINDMIHCGKLILKHSNNLQPQTLESDEVLYSFFIRQLEVMGEAASRLSTGFRHEYSDIPWKRIIGMRNILIHGYDDLIFEEIWRAVTCSVPELMPQLCKILMKS